MSYFNNFKKIILPLSIFTICLTAIAGFSGVFSIDTLASGLVANPCPAGGCPGIAEPGAVLGGDTKETISKFILGVAQFLTFISVAVAVVFMVWGGYQWMNVSDPKGAESGKTTVTNASIGLAVAILAYTIVGLLVGGLTGNWGGAFGVGGTPSGAAEPTQRP